MDPRIGVLNSGNFYAFANGYGAEPVIGTLEEVEAALGLRAVPVAQRPSRKKPAVLKSYNVLVKFEYPAWNEVDGIEYTNISARSKSEANKLTRRRAYDDGHTVGRRAWFTATEA